MRIALVDADTIAYRAGFAELEVNMRRSIDDTMNYIMDNTMAEEARIYLGGTGNFRYDIYPQYKANRIGKDDPPHRQEAKQYLVDHWDAFLVDGIEADDRVAIDNESLRECGENPIVCAIDKDLLQLPGEHFNYDKGTWTTVSEWDGLKTFYQGLLIGDRADHIFGVDGIGPKKSMYALQWCESEWELFETVRDMYDDDERLLVNGRCMWLLRSLPVEDNMWKFPEEVQRIEPEIEG